MKKRTVYERNRFGVKVKKCCASCQHKCINLDGTRLCVLMDLIVPPDLRCPKWDIHEGLLHVGESGGKVKSRQYLKFVQDVREQEQAAIEAGQMKLKDCQSIDALRTQFEELFGVSPFLTDFD